VGTRPSRRALTRTARDTRAYFRGRCLQRWAPRRLAAANWDFVFDLGLTRLRVPMRNRCGEPPAHIRIIVCGMFEPGWLFEQLGS